MRKIKNIDDLIRETYEGRYAEQFLSGARQFQRQLSPLALGRPPSMPTEDILKADDPLLSSVTTYYNAVYGRASTSWLNLEPNIWSLLPKGTYQNDGRFHWVVSAQATNFWGQLETAAAFGDTDKPDITKLDFGSPAYMYNHWECTLPSILEGEWQETPGGDIEAFQRDHFLKQHPSDINAWLCKDCDTLAKSGGSYDNYIESIDRVCSDAAESALLSAATDNDIYGLDRDAGAGNAYCDLNGGVNRDLHLGLIDDMIASCKRYADGDFIMITDETQLNTIESLESQKLRYEEGSLKIDSVNGVNTREGKVIGFSVAAYHGAGRKVPIFTTKDCHAETSGNGNIYLLDLGNIEIRVALPTVYLSTRREHYPVMDAGFTHKYVLLTVAQLCAKKFACHGAIKYLN